MNKRLKGACWMCLSAFSITLMSSTVKLMGTSIPTFEKIFFRNIIETIVIFILIRGKDIKILGNSNKGRFFMIIRSFTGLTDTILYFYSINYLYLADSTLLNKLSPFFVTFFATLFLKEKFQRKQIPLLLLVLIGALLIIKPRMNVSILPALAGFISAIFSGISYTLLRYLRHLENPESIVLWFACISIIGSFIPMILHGFIIPSHLQLLYLILTGIFATICQLSLAYAYKNSKANEVSIYQYLSIVFSAILGFFLWHEIPDISSSIGGLIILLVAIFNYYLLSKPSNPPLENEKK